LKRRGKRACTAPALKRPESVRTSCAMWRASESAAVQAALLGNRAKRKRWRSCSCSRVPHQHRRPPDLHACHTVPKEEQGQRSYRSSNRPRPSSLIGLGWRTSENDRPVGKDGIARLTAAGACWPLYESLGRLTDEDLDQLHILLPILCFGEERLDELTPLRASSIGLRPILARDAVVVDTRCGVLLGSPADRSWRSPRVRAAITLPAFMADQKAARRGTHDVLRRAIRPSGMNGEEKMRPLGNGCPHFSTSGSKESHGNATSNLNYSRPTWGGFFR